MAGGHQSKHHTEGKRQWACYSESEKQSEWVCRGHVRSHEVVGDGEDGSQHESRAQPVAGEVLQDAMITASLPY